MGSDVHLKNAAFLGNACSGEEAKHEKATLK